MQANSDLNKWSKEKLEELFRWLDDAPVEAWEYFSGLEEYLIERLIAKDDGTPDDFTRGQIVSLRRLPALRDYIYDILKQMNAEPQNVDNQ